MTRKPKGAKDIQYDNYGRPVSYIPVEHRKEVRPVYKQPQLTIFDHIFSSKRKRKEELARIEFEQSTHRWQDRQQNESAKANRRNLELQKVLDSERKVWETEEAKYKNRQIRRMLRLMLCGATTSNGMVGMADP